MSAPQERPSILIVDDTPENLDVLKRTLMDDYTVRPVLNGPTALRLAMMDPPPDLILLDIMMPEMDGFEVCRQLKRDPRTQDIPIIFVTAKTNAQDELEGLQMGAVDFISKPVNPPVVLARVKTQLAMRNFNQDMEAKNRRLYEINEKLSDSLDQLSASEERFRSLVQTIPDIVYKIDAEGRFTFLNKSVERLGYHQSDLIGKHFSELIHIADVPNASLQRVLEKVGKGNANPGQKVFDERRSGVRMTVGLEIRLRAKSGKAAEVVEIKNIDDSTVNVEVNSTGLYGEVGSETSYRTRQYVGTVGVIRDITDRQKAQKAFIEERMLLRQLIDSVPLPIFLMEKDAKILLSNNAFRMFSGVDGDDLEGACITDVLGQDENRHLKEMISTLVQPENDKSRLKQEVIIDLGDGKARVLDVILSKFQKIEQALPTVIGVMMDVTEQKEFTNKLITAREHAEALAIKAEEASRAKGAFLANMSHEIRTPLNAVIGLNHLCMQTDLTEKQRDYLTKVGSSANALLSLINDILDFSKIEAGRLDLECEYFSLEESLGGVVAMFGAKTQEKGLEFLLDVDPGVPMNLDVDAHRLGQVLINLVGNAIKFTETGEVAIHVRALEIGLDEVTLQFTVLDSGIGMTSGQMGRLFQEFSQGDASTTRKYGGTGLGLAISKRLVELMGGQISVESRPGQGSRFIFTSRFSVDDKRSGKIPVPSEEIRDLRILVVDDNEHARTVEMKYLEALGWRPEYASSGAEAVEAFRKGLEAGKSHNLILMDWKMPGMDGLEATKAIHEIAAGAAVKVIMSTAYGQNEVFKSSQEESLVDGYVLKPVTISSLFNVIMATFGHGPVVGKLSGGSTLSDKTLAGMKILLAEDNEINQQVAYELLAQAGVHVVIANNGREAVDLVQTDSFDGVLMDVQMPEMDGYEATRTLRKEVDHEKLPIIAMTANAMSGDREKCMESGMNDHVAKPVVPQDLYEALSRWVKGRSCKSSNKPKPFATSRGPGAHAPTPPLKGVDTTTGLRNMGGNAELYSKVLRKFTRNQGGAGQSMQESLEAQDGLAIENCAHALKGVASTIGARNLAELAGRIEQRAKTEEGLVGMADLLAETSSELARVVQVIETTYPDQTDDIKPMAESEMDPEALKPLFIQAVAFLEAFDSSVEKVVRQLNEMALGERQRKRLKVIQEGLNSYDFESCLTLFREWAAEENIVLKEEP